MVFSFQEREFIGSLEAKLPGLSDNFERAVRVAPDQRPDWAKEELKRVYRDGWFTGAEIGWHPVIPIKSAEIVFDHVQSLKALAKIHFSGSELQEIDARLDVHDDSEALAHNLLQTQGQMIRRDINMFRGMVLGPDAVGVVSADVKAKIEEIAVNVLFEADPVRKEMWLDFESKGSDAAQIAGALDKVGVMVKCGEYLDLGMTSDDFKAYWDHWTFEKIKQTCHPRVTQIYGDVIWPEIRESMWAADSRGMEI